MAIYDCLAAEEWDCNFRAGPIAHYCDCFD